MNDPQRPTGRILILDDDPKIRAFIDEVLSRAGYIVDQVEDLKGMRDRMAGVFFDAVLLDLELDHEDGIEGLDWILRTAPFTKVFILTSHGSVTRAVDCMRRGASGFFEKGTRPDAIIAELDAMLGGASQTAHKLPEDNFGLYGESDAIHELREMIDKLRDVDSTVLILGESGTGKEVVARAIHNSSQRSKYRFDAINCGAIPEALLESELFGHRKGSFTDAKTDRKGIFEVCSKGTLLLDEIGDMPLVLQTKLLRVLQERQVTPVGANEPVTVDTRVIAATHADIYFEAKSKRFREDLFYRLSIVVIRIPPLRHRVQDLPILINHFLRQCNERFGREVRPPLHATMSRLMAYDWPGNVRELKNAVERAVVLSTDGELSIQTMFQHLAAPVRETQLATATSAGSLPSELLALPLTESRQSFERFYMDQLMRQCGGNIVDVAQRSGRYRADVYRLLHRYGLDPADYR